MYTFIIKYFAVTKGLELTVNCIFIHNSVSPSASSFCSNKYQPTLNNVFSTQYLEQSLNDVHFYYKVFCSNKGYISLTVNYIFIHNTTHSFKLKTVGKSEARISKRKSWRNLIMGDSFQRNFVWKSMRWMYLVGNGR